MAPLWRLLRWKQWRWGDRLLWCSRIYQVRHRDWRQCRDSCSMTNQWQVLLLLSSFFFLLSSFFFLLSRFFFDSFPFLFLFISFSFLSFFSFPFISFSFSFISFFSSSQSWPWCWPSSSNPGNPVRQGQVLCDRQGWWLLQRCQEKAWRRKRQAQK